MKVFIISLLVLFNCFSFSQSRELIRPFTTDICTGWKNSNNKYNWSECCIKHDLSMWAGGTKQQRRVSDKELRLCVKSKSNGFNALIMYLGTRIGSYSPFKIKSKRWGNAWSKNFRYKKLNSIDIDQLEDHLKRSNNQNLDLDLVNIFISKLRKENIY